MAKLLIVDDDKTTVDLLQMLLEMDGFEIRSVGRGADVPQLVDEFQPDVILMDYHLSDMEGVDVLRDLRANDQYKTLPIVMASGRDVEDEVIAAGANKFVLKPPEPDELAPLFNSLIEG